MRPPLRRRGGLRDGAFDAAAYSATSFACDKLDDSPYLLYLRGRVDEERRRARTSVSERDRRAGARQFMNASESLAATAACTTCNPGWSRMRQPTMGSMAMAMALGWCGSAGCVLEPTLIITRSMSCSNSSVAEAVAATQHHSARVRATIGSGAA